MYRNHIMLTRGVAACIILDLIPTPENRVLAKKSLNNSLFDVAHTGTKHADPFPIAKVFIQKNPAKYKTFPDTPPLSPQLAPSPTPTPSPIQPPHLITESETNNSPRTDKPVNKNEPNNEGVDSVMQERSTIKDGPTLSSNEITQKKPNSDGKPSEKPQNLITALRSNQSIIMRIAKILFVRSHSYDNTYRLVYATDQFIYDVLNKHIPISRIWTLDNLVEALKDNDDHFEDYDQVISMRNIRILYMVKEIYQTQAVKKVLYQTIPNLCTYF